uniref:Zgc:153901 n=1 Tax=Cyprinus carpio TaxID=7962 RepID=A0A8C1KL37_CYPCA
RSAFTDTHGKKCSGITVLNIFIDIDYSRSVTLLLHFGWADSPQHRVPAKRRKAIGWFKKVLDMSAIQPDVGPQPTRRYGITGYFLKSTIYFCVSKFRFV